MGNLPRDLLELKSKFPNGHSHFIPLCLEEMALHSKKNADYAQGGDPLGNFKRVSDMLNSWGINISPATVALIYMMKQVDAVGRMIGKGYEGGVEGVGSRLQDIGVYAKLCAILVGEEKNE